MTNTVIPRQHMNNEKIKIRIYDRKSLLKEVPLILSEVVIGSDEECNIRLNHPSISPKHLKIRIDDKSTVKIEPVSVNSPVFVDDKRIDDRMVLPIGKRVKIGNFSFEISREIVSTPIEKESEGGLKLRVDAKIVADKRDEFSITQNSLKREIFKEIKKQGGLKDTTSIRDKEEIRAKLAQILKQKNGIQSNEPEAEPDLGRTQCRTQITFSKNKYPGDSASNRELEDKLLDEIFNLGPLGEFLLDKNITEIMVNGIDEIYIEKNGRLILTGEVFCDKGSLVRIINRLLGDTGKRITDTSFIIDSRLKDGSRLNVIMPPLSVKGPNVTIRKFKDIPLTTESLVKMSTITETLAEFLEVSVKNRVNILISGGTSSGKTTLLNFLSSFIPDNERIITIEDTAELKLKQNHVVQLESKTPDANLDNGVPIRALVINALRMRPDRIIVGECRGSEALDMLQAMNTGHDGSMTTLHANSPRDVFARLETMVLMSGIELNTRAVRNHISSAIQLIIHMARMSDGSRRIIKVTEISGMEQDIISTSDLFVFKQEGLDSDGRVIGNTLPTGIVPSFYDKLKTRGLKPNSAIFKVPSSV